MANVDKRVVEMKFDNAAFERGVSNTLSTLDKLKSKLNFDGAVKGLGNLNTAGKNVDLSGMGQGVDAIQSKFSALEVAGVTALATLTNKAVNSGLQVAKSLTIGPISGGYSDYNEKLTSVQTIMSATGKDIKTVNSHFKELDTYSDKTIYNLSDMTGAFAKFTNAGLDMDKSVPAIKGIANMVALAGQGAGAASIAMYNLSQSIAGGFLTTIDYKSLNLANVATKEWKDQMIAGAVASGNLKKTADGTYATFNNGVRTTKKSFTTASLFTEGLSEQWATTGVLTKVLGDYGDTTTAIGKKAQAAAQDVRSLPMMMETLKAAVGTGWTDSFEFILGNVEESKKLFTGMTNAIGGVLEKSSQSRNHMLHQWKSLGGRTAIIDSVRNSWQALGAILKPIGDAFKSVFPSGGAGKTLSDFSYKLREITSHLKVGKETAENIKRTFQGLFSILKIGVSIGTGLFKALLKVFGVLGTGAGGGLSALLEFTAKAGDFLTSIQKWIAKTSAIEKFFTILTSPLKILKPVIGILVKLANAFAKLLTGDISGFKESLSDVGDTLKGMFVGILKGFKGFADFLSNGLYRISQLFTIFSLNAGDSGNSLVSKITGSIAEFFAYISNFATNLSIMASRLTSTFTGVTSEGQNFLSGFGSGALERVMGLINKVSGVFKNLKVDMDFKGTFASFSNNADSAASGGGNALASIGGVISAIWGSLGDIAGGIGTVATNVVSALGKFFGYIGPKIRDYLKTFDMQDLIAILNTGLLFTVVMTFRKIAKDVGGALNNMTAPFQQLTGTLKTMQNSVRSKIILAIAIAVGILVTSLVLLAKIPAQALGVGLAALTGLFVQIAVMMKVIDKIDPKSMIGAGIGMVAIATAVLILSHAIENLGKMDPGVLAQGAAALVALMAALAGMAFVLNGMKGILAAATGLLILAAAMTAMAGAIALYAAIPVDVLKKGIISMGIALLALGLAMRAFPKGMVLQAVGIGILAAALVVLVGVITALGNLPTHVIVKGIVALAVGLLILAVAANAMTGALPGAAAMLIMAAAIAVLAPALALLGSLPMKVIGKGLLAIAALMLIFVAAMYLLTPVIAVMLLFSSSLLTLGLAMLAAGTGFALFVGALALLTVVGAAGFAVLAAGIISLIALLPLMAQQLGYAVITFAKVIGDAAPKVAEAAGKVIMAFIDEVARLIPKIYAAGLDMIIGLLTAIRDRIGEITQLVIDIITIFITTLAENIGPVIAAGGRFLLALINGLADWIRKNNDRIGRAGMNIASAIIEGIGKGLRAAGHLAREALERMGQALIDAFKRFFGINSPSTVFADLGGYLIEGLVNGFKNGYHLVKDAVVGLGKKLPGWMQKVLGIESPSTVFHALGSFVGQGFANGIDSSTGLVNKATTGMGTDALSSIKTVMSNIGDSISSNMDSTPTIRPILDLSHVEKNAGKLDSMLSTNPLLSDVAYSKAKDIASGYTDNQAASLFDATQTRKALQTIAAMKPTQSDSVRPVTFNIDTVQDGDSLLRRARATNKMLTLAEGGDSTQVVNII